MVEVAAHTTFADLVWRHVVRFLRVRPHGDAREVLPPVLG